MNTQASDLLRPKGVRVREVVKYATLPRILPRISELFFSGFGYFAFFMAQVYRGVRLLPEGHPYLSPAHIGQYSIAQVVSQAARHLTFRKENLDQIIIFFALLLGLVLLVLQAFVFMMALFLPQAFAFGAFFGLPQVSEYLNGSQDLAFILMDRVFGVPGIFNSCVSITTPCAGTSADLQLDFSPTGTVYTPPNFPWPYHTALHAMFQFYSMGLLVVGIFLFLYFIVVIIAETAQTGVPFGKRFNSVWAPIRLVVAIGLLIPLANGLNAAQYITLYAAKWGSNFATNGWILFSQVSADEMRNNANNLVVKPQEADVAGMLQFMSLAHACKAFTEDSVKTAITPQPSVGSSAIQALGQSTANQTGTGGQKKCESNKADVFVDAWIVRSGGDMAQNAKRLSAASYEDALAFSNNGDITIRFGDRDCDYAEFAGNTYPNCGEIVLPTTALTEPGARVIQEGYFEQLKHLWGDFRDAGDNKTVVNYTNGALCRENDIRNALIRYGDGGIIRHALQFVFNKKEPSCADSNEVKAIKTALGPQEQSFAEFAATAYRIGDGKDPAGLLSAYEQVSGGASGMYPQLILTNIINKAVDEQRAAIRGGSLTINGKTYTFDLPPENIARGWGGAAIWYNQIAKMNGALVGAAWNVPSPSRMPALMEDVLRIKRQTNQGVDPRTQFSPTLGTNQSAMYLGSAEQISYAQGLSDIYQSWYNAQMNSVYTPKTGNVLSDAIRSLFGIQGLFNLRDPENKSAHPLAQLVGIGKGLIEATIRNLGLGLVGAGGGILASLVQANAVGSFAMTVSGLFFSAATITLTAGFILFYVIPFLPFLYFFFAMGNWVKGVFEAMVGVPLWALAHLRIDGNGLPGDAAANGYYMIFEIFLRPILILFGLMAAVTIFAAMAAVLHDIFDLVVGNLTGYDPTGTENTRFEEIVRSPIDQLFFTVMYAVILYIMALSSFKLIDLIPNQIMRWMGTSVSTFSDMTQDPAQNLTQYTAIAGSQITQQITGGLQQGAQAAQGLASAAGKMGKNN